MLLLPMATALMHRSAKLFDASRYPLNSVPDFLSEGRRSCKKDSKDIAFGK
jgi:hypothetical protein